MEHSTGFTGGQLHVGGAHAPAPGNTDIGAGPLLVAQGHGRGQRRRPSFQHPYRDGIMADDALLRHFQELGLRAPMNARSQDYGYEWSLAMQRMQVQPLTTAVNFLAHTLPPDPMPAEIAPQQAVAVPGTSRKQWNVSSDPGNVQNAPDLSEGASSSQTRKTDEETAAHATGQTSSVRPGASQGDLLNSDELDEIAYYLCLLQPEEFGVDPMLLRAFEAKRLQAGHAFSRFPSPRLPPREERPSRHHSLYKTELCRSFSETGVCKYGTKCQFSHGARELRPALRHPKYKTSVCKTFLRNGSCPYGSRCRFIHEGDERDSALRERDISVKYYRDLMIKHQQQVIRLRQEPGGGTVVHPTDTGGNSSIRQPPDRSRFFDNNPSLHLDLASKDQVRPKVSSARLAKHEPAYNKPSDDLSQTRRGRDIDSAAQQANSNSNPQESSRPFDQTSTSQFASPPHQQHSFAPGALAASVAASVLAQTYWPDDANTFGSETFEPWMSGLSGASEVAQSFSKPLDLRHSGSGAEGSFASTASIWSGTPVDFSPPPSV